MKKKSTSLIVTDQEIRQARRRPCPRCCRGLARDRDQLRLKRGRRYIWVCESTLNIGDTDCGTAAKGE